MSTTQERRALRAASLQQGVRRLVCMSNVGAGDSASYGPWLYRALILPVFLKWLVAILEDKERMEPIVRESGLDWVMPRFPAILDRPARGRIRESYDGRGMGFSITAADTAGYLLDQLETDRNVGKAPAVSN